MEPSSQSGKYGARLRDLLSEALEITDVEERRRFVRDSCIGDPDLRKLIGSLIASHERAGDFLNRSIFGDETNPLDEKPGTVIGPYRLVEKLGEGGFGVVYVAEQQTPMKRQVALKIIKLGMDTKQVIARFEAEREVLAMMNHPHIARVFEAGSTETGRPYFVMELVDGQPITEFCDARSMNTSTRLELFVQVCAAVQHAHQKGIIHRDLKPSNIVVALQDGRPEAKVIDFGIAKTMSTALDIRATVTCQDLALGTPAYMSPEQVDVGTTDVDLRTDIYSLGVLLYELLTGCLPFGKETLREAALDELRRIIREEDPVKPSTQITIMGGRASEVARLRGTEPTALRRKLRGDLDWIVIKALEKDCSRRYESVDALTWDLRRYQRHEPIQARPPSLAYQCRKWIRRNKVAFAMTSVVAAAVIAVATVATISSLKSQRLVALQNLRHGQSLGDRGKVAAGLHWMVRALEGLPPGNSDIRQVIEENLSMWERHLARPETVLVHESWVGTGDISPGGERVVTGTAQGALTLWSIPSGNPVWRKPDAHSSGILSVAISSDGKRILSMGGTNLITRLWDSVSGEPVGNPMPSTGVGGLAFSPDGRWVIAGGGKNAARIYSAESGLAVSPLLQHDDEIRCLLFSPDGERALTGGRNGMIRFWMVESGLGMDPVIRTEGIKVVAFSRDGKLLATGAFDGGVRLWSVETGEQLFSTIKHDDVVLTIDFHPDGSRFVTGSRDWTARLWSTRTGLPIGRPIRANGWAGSTSFSPDGKFVLVGAGLNNVQLYSAETAEAVSLPLGHEANVILKAYYNSIGNRILTIPSALETHVWNTEGLESRVRTLKSGVLATTAKISPDGQLAATANHWGQGEISIWDVETGERRAHKMAHSEGVWMVAFSPDSQRLASAGKDGVTRVWDLGSNSSLVFQLKHQNAVRCVDFSADGELIATGSFDRTLRLWSARDGSLKGVPMEHPSLVESLVFTPDGSAIVTACNDGAVRVWSTETLDQLVSPIRHQASLLDTDISPDGRLIAVGGRGKVVRFWDASNGQPIGPVLVHEGFVDDVSFSPNGRWLVTVESGTVRFWSVTTGEQIGPSQWFSARECVFGPTGRQVVLSDYDGRCIRLLEAPLPPPIEGYPDPRLWVEVITKREIDENGVVKWLSPDVWRSKFEQLKPLTGR